MGAGVQCSRKAVLAAATSNESVFQYICKYQGDLEQKVVFAWEFHDAPEEVELDNMSNWGCVLATCKSPCICNQRWIPLTEELLSKRDVGRWAVANTTMLIAMAREIRQVAHD